MRRETFVRVAAACTIAAVAGLFRVGPVGQYVAGMLSGAALWLAAPLASAERQDD